MVRTHGPGDSRAPWLCDWRSISTQRAAGPEKASQCKQRALNPSLTALFNELAAATRRIPWPVRAEPDPVACLARSQSR